MLQNNVPITGISGALNSQLFYSLDVPAGATNLSFSITGSTPDADLYTRFGSLPTTSLYDCRPFTSTSNETCSFAAPQAGTYFVMVRGFTAYSGVTLKGSYTIAGPTATPTPVPPTATPTLTPVPGSQVIVNGGFEGSASPGH